MRPERMNAGEMAELLGAVLDAAPDAIAFLDCDGHVLLESRPMRELRAQAGSAGVLRVGGAHTGPESSHASSESSTTELELDAGHRIFSRQTAPVADSA